MLEKGSLDGQRIWKRVLAAVKKIRRQEPREGDMRGDGPAYSKVGPRVVVYDIADLDAFEQRLIALEAGMNR